MKTPDFPGFFRNLARFAAYCGQRFASDQCLRIATQLSYASLLAVVPVLAICFGLLSAFPGFEHLRVPVGDVGLLQVCFDCREFALTALTG